jgi:hypothetical protein
MVTAEPPRSPHPAAPSARTHLSTPRHRSRARDTNPDPGSDHPGVIGNERLTGLAELREVPEPLIPRGFST